jgi:hypothetical protein
LRISIIASALFLLFLSMNVRSQDVEEQSTDSEAEATEVEENEAAAETEPEPEEERIEFDETGLDEQGFSNEDDDFAPSEDIPTDQSIEFPADI